MSGDERRPESPLSDADERLRALDYEVDADAVARAIVERLLAGRLPSLWRST